MIPTHRARYGARARTAAVLYALVVAGANSARADDATAQPEPPPAAAPPAAPSPVASRARVDLTATVDPEARLVSGTVVLALPNVSGAALTELKLWLYPNRLRDRPAALGDVNFHWLYPRGFSPAAMRIRAARAGGAPIVATVGASAAGRDTIALLALPAPVPPGGVARVEIDFTTELPVRLGGFGCAGTQCRMMGGFYPFPLHLGPAGFVEAAAPDRIDFSARVSVPGGADVVLGDVAATRDTGAGSAAGSVAVAVASGENVPYITLVVDRDLRVDELAVRGFRLRFFHHGVRPPSSADEALPYVREDRAGLVLDGARRALALLAELFAEQGLTAAAAGGDRPLTVVEAPLRHELVQVHGDVVLVSDRLFAIFPVERLRKFHRFELARAVMAAALGRVLARSEPDPDIDLATDVLATSFTEAFTLHDARRLEFARDLLRPLSFVPAVDQLLYAPLVASSSSYFGDADDRDVVRDDVRRFSQRTPGGRLVYVKLVDLLGAHGVAQLARTMLADRVPLRRAAARIFGADLAWFWRQWQGDDIPGVNYRLARIATTPLMPAGVHARIDVERQGADLREPVEVRVLDRAGAAHDLVWNEPGPTHRFDLDLPAGLSSVEIDPRHRLVESALGALDASDDPLVDNRDPRRLRVIYSGFGALLDITALQASFAAAVTVKPQHDLHNSLLVIATRSPSTTAGISAAYARLFGRQADRNRLTTDAGLGLSAAVLDPDYGVGSNEAVHARWRLGANLFLEYDDRDYFIDPWRAIGFSVGIHTSLTGIDTGQHLAQAGAALEALRLLEIAPGHVLAFDVQTGVTFGDIRVRSQLGQIGGPFGLRGFGGDELFGRGEAVGHIELRDRYLSDLDWNIAHFTSVRGFGGNLFVDAGVVTSCSDLGVGKNDVFTDVGYSFRILHDAFGVYQQMMAIDLAIPLNRHDRVCLGQHALGAPGMPLTRPPFVVLVSFLPSF